VPAAETVEILVYLAQHNEAFGQQAALTLAGWDENATKKVVADPATPKEVLDYLVNPQNLRPGLLAALEENPSISEEALEKLGRAVAGESLDVMLNSPRVVASLVVMRAIQANLNLNQTQAAKVKGMLAPGTPDFPAEQAEATAAPTVISTGPTEQPAAMNSEEHDAEVAAFLKEHAAELAQEGDKPFQPIGGIHDEFASESTEKAQAAAPAAIAPAPAASTPAVAAPKKAATPQERGSTLQKIAALGITGRIQLAMKGSKEERSLLIRDGTKIVALAVLQSPKISDGEVEKIATQKNVLEAVLRAIPMKRQFAKNYVIVRNLVANPRTPLDVALGLMKNLMVNDLKALSGNKEVSETIRKLAIRQFKQKSEDANKK